MGAVERKQLGVLGIVVLGCLLPFVGKPFHVDDPMFVWAAERILVAPLDFYGFDVNWYGALAPMYQVNKNPPLVSFYMATVGALAGFGERALHAALWLPALAAVGGTWALARRLDADPLLAALACWLTPAVLVSSTTLMSDVSMLALFVWAVFFWVRGLEEERPADLVAAGVLAGLCPIAKYFGLALLPLLAAHGLARERRVGPWALYLLLPALIFGAYELHMIRSYGYDPLGDVAGYVFSFASPGRLRQAVVGLSFAGGALLPVLLFAPWLWPPRALLAGAGALAALVALLVATGRPAALGLFVFAGAHLLLLAGRDLHRRRDAAGMLLLLWIAGSWVFCSFANWTPTVRAVLPMAPAAGILVGRALRRPQPGAWQAPRVALVVPLCAGLVLSLAVAHGDAGLAAAGREAAATLAERYGAGGGRLYFQGAWGFQHYMESHGARRIALGSTVLRPGDVVVTPLAGSNLLALPEHAAATLEVAAFQPGGRVATMSRGAGFYAALSRSLPFAFGVPAPERYRVQRVRAPLRLDLPEGEVSRRSRAP